MIRNSFMLAQTGQKAPNLKVSKWVQGMDTNLDKQGDNIVLVEVFQVNCPGCFMYGIPNLYKFTTNTNQMVYLCWAWQQLLKIMIKTLLKIWNFC